MHYFTVITFNLPYQLPGFSISFLGLPRNHYYFFSPFVRQCYPSSSYIHVGHYSARTVLLNFRMNDRLNLACGTIINSGTDGFQKYIHIVADKLKFTNPSCSFKFADIIPHVSQNWMWCYKPNFQVVNLNSLKWFVPSRGNTVVLNCCTSTCKLFRNDQFGPPPV